MYVRMCLTIFFSLQKYYNFYYIEHCKLASLFDPWTIINLMIPSLNHTYNKIYTKYLVPSPTDKKRSSSHQAIYLMIFKYQQHEYYSCKNNMRRGIEQNSCENWKNKAQQRFNTNKLSLTESKLQSIKDRFLITSNFNYTYKPQIRMKYLINPLRDHHLSSLCLFLI